MAKAGSPGATCTCTSTAGLHPLKSDGGNALDHAAPLMQSRVAEPGGVSKNITGTDVSASD
jgi:hypothetical protein